MSDHSQTRSDSLLTTSLIFLLFFLITCEICQYRLQIFHIVDEHNKLCQTKNRPQVDHTKNSPSYPLMNSYLLKICQGIHFQSIYCTPCKFQLMNILIKMSCSVKLSVLEKSKYIVPIQLLFLNRAVILSKKPIYIRKSVFQGTVLHDWQLFWLWFF